MTVIRGLSPLVRLKDFKFSRQIEYSMTSQPVRYWMDLSMAADWKLSSESGEKWGEKSGFDVATCHVQLTHRVAHAQSPGGHFSETLPDQDYLWSGTGQIIDGVPTDYVFPAVYAGMEGYGTGYMLAYGPYLYRRLGRVAGWPIDVSGSDSRPIRVSGVNKFSGGIPASVGGGMLTVGMRGQAREYTLGPLYLSQLRQHANDSRLVDVLGSTGKPGDTRLIATLQFD